MFLPVCVSQSFAQNKACSPLSPYTLFWATDVYLVSWLVILIFKVTHVWNLLNGRIPHMEQGHRRCCWVELTHHHPLDCIWMWFVVLLHFSRTSAEKTEPGRNWTESWEEWNTTYRETLSTFPTLSLKMRASRLTPLRWGSGGVLSGRLNSLTEKVCTNSQVGSSLKWLSRFTLQWSLSVEIFLSAFWSCTLKYEQSKILNVK